MEQEFSAVNDFIYPFGSMTTFLLDSLLFFDDNGSTEKRYGCGDMVF